MRWNKKKYSIILIGVLIVVGLVYSVSNNTNNAGTLDFTVSQPSELSLTGTKIPDITCSAQQVNTIVDSVGRTVTVKSSSVFRNNPLFVLTSTTSNNPIAGAVPELMFGCLSNGAEITVKPSTLTLKVYGTNSAGSSVIVGTDSISTASVKFPKGTTALKSLGWFSVYGKDIEARLQSDTKYKTTLRFEVSGNVQIYYSGYPSAVYTFPISATSIPTDYAAYVDAKYSPTTSTVKASDVDKDGIIDIYDTCPGSPETFNGYKDTDGCPDTNPNTPAPTPATEQPPVDKNSCPADQVWSVNKCVPKSTATTCSVKVSSEGIVSNSCLPLKSFVAYQINLEGGAVSGTVPNVPTFDVAINALPSQSLTGDLRGEQHRVATITLRPQIDFNAVQSGTTLSNPKFTHTYDLILNGKPVVEKQEFSGSQISYPNVITSTRFYQISLVSINPQDMFQKMKEKLGSDFTLKTGDTLQFVMNVGGSLDVRIGQDKYSAVVDGLTYTYDMVESTSALLPEPCQGLNGQELIDCKTKPTNNPADCTAPFKAVQIREGQFICIDSNATGGQCTDLSSQQCIDSYNMQPKDSNPVDDFIDLITGKPSGNPSGSPGISGVCQDLDVTACFNSIKDQFTDPSDIEKQNTLIMYAVAIFIIVIIIVLIIAIGRKRRG